MKSVFSPTSFINSFSINFGDIPFLEIRKLIFFNGVILSFTISGEQLVLELTDVCVYIYIYIYIYIYLGYKLVDIKAKISLQELEGLIRGALFEIIIGILSL